MKVSRTEVKTILAATYPEYTGRKVNMVIAETVNVHDLNWGGGTKNYYKILELSKDLKAREVPSPAPWANPYEGQTLAMRPGYAIVRHSHFCGHDCGITIYVHPMDIPARYLPVAA